MSEFFDFGFTAVTEEELETVQEITIQAQVSASTADQLQNKIDNLYNAVIPLLNNLKKNPEKDYIHWPNRLSKVEEFETYLNSIYTK
jgi:uncharacterized protein involved in tolerance to divalent cations